MTPEQFNIKYNKFLVPSYYGLDIHNTELIDWLDSKFQEFIMIPGFSYTQIKIKFFRGQFYCTGLSSEQIEEVEDKITTTIGKVLRNITPYNNN